MQTKHIPHFQTEISANSFGFDEQGNECFIYEISNGNGMILRATDFGATITSLKIPDNSGALTDVGLGFECLKDYIDSFGLPSAPYLGATVGRYAGRIAHARCQLNGKTIQLDSNHRNHALHGGHRGFSQQIWKCVPGTNTLTFTRNSPDGEGGYPGTLDVSLTYSLTDDNELKLEYVASADKDTIINLTHHSYFNLDGHDQSIVWQQLTVNSGQLLETDPDNVPTGNFINVQNTEFDFRSAKPCPKRIDHTFVLDNEEVAATLSSRSGNLQMEVRTNQPGLHIYVGGNCFGRIQGKEDAAYHNLSGICFETQNFPDAPNHAHFPTAILKKGDSYHHRTTYKFINPSS
ncbi:galactose-1-epimerase [Flavobacterium magnum]|uniref:Aldose 1-epimerase n=1 Tax=Flavobacterium magnum TaxID=2162713 RepID=A0A2S0RCK4_9FLAO|nr:aldose epimerase family protein [Flavobacterium magnum]AWA29483.1 galactose-1-epimerase [Flavobacterium magnum]